MKLNGLTNNLKGNDKSLSNSYLSHIVELLREEVERLSDVALSTSETLTDHIETQKTIVETKTVKAEKVETRNINDIILLNNVIDVLTDLKVNGHKVVTDESFTGPFQYKGVVEQLPELSTPGDVYICNDVVYIKGPESWNSFDIPLGTISKTEYDADRKEMLSDISEVSNATKNTSTKLDDYITLNDEKVANINDEITEINEGLANKVDQNPVDDTSYVRNNNEWVPLSVASNAVASIIGESEILNSKEGVSISTPKLDITSPDIKVNGKSPVEVGKFGLVRESSEEDDYYYEMKYGEDSSFPKVDGDWYGPFDSSAWATTQIGNPNQATVFTKNWQYCKWTASGIAGNNTKLKITAMNKDGHINVIPNIFVDWTVSDVSVLQGTNFITFNQEYCPDEWQDTVYLFCPGTNPTASNNTQKAYLVELKDGKFSRKIDIYNSVGGLKDQGYKLWYAAPDTSRYIGQVGGKSLRNKDIQRICMVVCDGTDGGSWAIIIGGNKDSKPTDPFDPTKCIYIPLPAKAYYASANLSSTDLAWYLTEYQTGRIMRITPNGQVVEFNLSQSCLACGYSYLEYTDSNNRPACAYYLFNNTSGAKHYVVFFEEGENGQVNFIEKEVKSDSVTPLGSEWYAQWFRFCENSHYIFFTADCGTSQTVSSTNYGRATMKNALWYWDKKTHTTHCIPNFYDTAMFGSDSHSFIDMYKTRGGAIWFPYMIQDFNKTRRTGEIHYISDIDYTNIDENEIDVGEIEVQSANVGTDNAFFTSGNYSDYSFVRHSHLIYSNDSGPTWDRTGFRTILAATNDDGILCIMSSDLKAIALCYGDGSVKVYSNSKSAGVYDCDGDVEPFLAGDIPNLSTNTDYYPALFGMAHGWVLRTMSTEYTNAQYTYIGIQYKNGEPTILKRPHISWATGSGTDPVASKTNYEKYIYLQTYDDYERRKKVLSGIRANLTSKGKVKFGEYFKEVKNGVDSQISLTYDGKIVDSVDV